MKDAPVVDAEAHEETPHEDAAEVTGAQLDALSAMDRRQRMRTNEEMAPAEILTESEVVADVPELVTAGVGATTATIDASETTADVYEAPAAPPLDSIDPEIADAAPVQSNVESSEPSVAEGVQENFDTRTENADAPLGRFVRTVLLVVGVSNLALAGFLFATQPGNGQVALTALAQLALSLVALSSWVVTARRKTSQGTAT